MTIASSLYRFLITILGASVIGDKIPDLKFTKMIIDHKPGNLYFDNWSSKISESSDTLSVAWSVKEDLPESMMFRIVAELNGDRIVFIEMEVCESFETGVADQNFLDHGYPKDEFPKGCPMKAGSFGVRDYKFSADNIPFEVPAGDFIVKFCMYEPNSEPLIILSLEGLLTYK